ncbi:hypothetical protein GCM10022421_12380 [Oceanisphaera sediminis]|uniref:O-antigen polymerase n=2 Tax=Oceanisphaera sediminis TaxID=981381 RepID=A0ABP7DL98_9GAMM
MGAALPLLIGFVALAGGTIFLQGACGLISVRLHFFIFLLLVVWVSLKVVIDLGDLEYLKQITVATTGGILLFFFVGAFVRLSLERITEPESKFIFAKLALFVFFMISMVVFTSYQGRLLDRDDIFYIEGVDGNYQRPGNFLIMLFIMTSFVYLTIVTSVQGQKNTSIVFWLFIYSVGLFFYLISSQMIGSNAATANLTAVYLMTVVISFLAFNNKLRNAFLAGKLTIPNSKKILKFIVTFSVVAVLSVLIFSIVALRLSGFDLNKTNLFGFGAGEITSVTSRLDILLESGVEQMGYAPFLGNTNVAYLTTGNPGKTLHSFLPNVMAELGLVGLLLVVLLFFFVLRDLYNKSKLAKVNQVGFQSVVVNMWLFFLLIFLLLYSNIAVGIYWAVMWFFIGFASEPLFLITKK